MKILQSENGFTLIEALIAMVVLTIGILALYTMQISSIRGNSHANRLTEASTWNAAQVERMIGLDYNLLRKIDCSNISIGIGTGVGNCNGTGQDTNQDGIDDDGGNFGLDDTTGNPAADRSWTTGDGRYTLYWNVAVDVPMKNLLTIRVLVQDNNKILSAPIVFTYIKRG